MMMVVVAAAATAALAGDLTDYYVVDRLLVGVASQCWPACT